MITARELSLTTGIPPPLINSRARRMGFEKKLRGKKEIYYFTEEQARMIINYQKFQRIVEIEKIIKIHSVYHIYPSKINYLEI